MKWWWWYQLGRLRGQIYVRLISLINYANTMCTDFTVVATYPWLSCLGLVENERGHPYGVFTYFLLMCIGLIRVHKKSQSILRTISICISVTIGLRSHLQIKCPNNYNIWQIPLFGRFSPPPCVRALRKNTSLFDRCIHCIFRAEDCRALQVGVA